MKKLGIFMAAGALTLSLAARGSGASSTTTTAAAAETTAAASTETTAAEIVSSAISGTAISQDGETVANGDGLTGIGFDVDVVVVEVPTG